MTNARVKADEAAGGFPPAGWVRRDDAARLLGVSIQGLKDLYAEGRATFGRVVAKPGRGWCKVYPLDAVQQLQAELDAERAEQHRVRGTLPAGFASTEEASELFGLSRSGWKKWKAAGRVPPGEWMQLAGKRTRVIAYRVEALLELKERLDAAGVMARNCEEEVRRRDRVRAERLARIEAARPPAGMIAERDVRRMFGVSIGVFKRWRLIGWVSGTMIAGRWYFDRATMEALVAEAGELRPPDPDPQRPRCLRVPVRGTRMKRDEVLIDEDVLPLIEGKCLNWSPEGGYDGGPSYVAVSAILPIPLRRLIMGVTDPGVYVVHANGDPLDCRRANLRTKSPAEVCQGNRKIETRAGRPVTSRFKGVCWEERTGRWVAQISVDGHRRRIGRYDDEIAAAEAYDEAAHAAWGEHARLNFPHGIDARLEQEAPNDDTADRRAA